jgi:hypothetical protein
LLVGRQGALWALRGGMSADLAAAHFGTSTALFRMRANVTGAAVQHAREVGRHSTKRTTR